MQRLSLLTAALLAVAFALPVHAGGKTHPAASQESAPTASSSNSLNPPMVRIPTGSFLMGSNQGDADERPLHRVDISAFEMGKTEVTQGLWEAVMGNNPAKFNTCGDNCPVEQVSWDDIQLFIAELNAQTGKNYRLPTEAEWEYACRAGGQHEEYCGNSVAGVAWYEANSDGHTHPVATKRANAWGLYDMSGNVWEWVQDWQPNSYGISLKYRVLRGGSWKVEPQPLRSTVHAYHPALRCDDYGFRLARTLP